MAKRRKRKHRPSASYLRLADKLQAKSIIPTIPTTAKASRIQSKQIRDTIRKAFAEQQKTITPKPSKTYNTGRKKNRKEARQKRKEKKQKAKQLQQQRQIDKEQTPVEIPTLDYGERDEDFRSEVGEIDDTNDYIEDLIAKVQYVYEGLTERYSKWLGQISDTISQLDRLEYWLEEALQLPYEQKRAICDTLEGNDFLEELNKTLHMEHYKEVEATIESVSEQIITIIESVY